MTTDIPEFEGPLSSRFAQFARKMASTGGKHATLFANIKRLDRFLASRHRHAASLTKKILSHWFTSFAHLRPQTQRRYRSATFQLCKYLRGHSPDTSTIHDFEPLRRSRAFKPHIFSPDEINTLLKAARNLPTRPTDPIRPWTIEFILVLLYTAGLRIGEVVRLDVSDYDADAGTLLIRETKFAKTRLVPLSQTAKHKLDSYLERRHELSLAGAPNTPILCPLKHGAPGLRPPLGCIQAALIRLMRQCGLKAAKGSGREGPRIHDLRHTFAVHCVLRWYRQGVDVQARLPYLATYLGHRGVESTQLYLSVIPEILTEASERFQLFARPTVGLTEAN